MRLNGRVIKGDKVLFDRSIRDTCAEDAPFRDKLEDCLIRLCKEADIAAPIWLTKNSRELGGFRKTAFLSEQFAEPVPFDRFEISILEP